MIYQPVFSLKTGWVVGVIENHQARPLTHDEVEALCKDLNELDKEMKNGKGE